MEKNAAIIAETPAPTHPPESGPLTQAPWQQALQQAWRDPAALLQALGLGGHYPAARLAEPDGFPLRVPRAYAARMRRGDPDDPLLRQVLPLRDEQRLSPGYSADPLAEQAAMAAPGLLHKYPGRALLTLTGACAVHCRYCFRRHYPYAEANPTRAHRDQALDYLRNDTGIEEIILSGGDPLSLPDHRLSRLVADLEGIPHLQRLRIHTRQPVVLPERVDEALLAWLSATRLQVVMVLHINHANEIDAALAGACTRLKSTGLTLLNQSVLLAGVNDAADTLTALSQRLFEVGVLPYYLHQLDRVQGAAHFAVSDQRARELVAAIRARLPGYLVPTLAREEPGVPHKTPL